LFGTANAVPVPGRDFGREILIIIESHSIAPSIPNCQVHAIDDQRSQTK